jgi:hypothetical protein
VVKHLTREKNQEKSLKSLSVINSHNRGIPHHQNTTAYYTLVTNSPTGFLAPCMGEGLLSGAG